MLYFFTLAYLKNEKETMGFNVSLDVAMFGQDVLLKERSTREHCLSEFLIMNL